MESSIVFTYLIAAAASRAMARAVTAVVNTMLVIAVWSALAVMGAMLLVAKLPAVGRRLVRPIHLQIHW